MERPEAPQHVVAQHLPGPVAHLEAVLVLEERDPAPGGRPVGAAPRGTPLLAHPAQRLIEEPGLRQVPPGVEDPEGHLDRLVDDATGPALAAGELLEDVEAPDVVGGTGSHPPQAP